MNSTLTERLASATSLLLPFALAMVGASAVVQLTIVLTGHEIGVLCAALTGVLALGYAVLLRLRGRDLARVRFGVLATHVVTYAAVNVGFGLHFFALALANHPAIRADPEHAAEFAMDPGWFGAAIAMPAFWGVGLLVHALGAIAGRGFEADR